MDGLFFLALALINTLVPTMFIGAILILLIRLGKPQWSKRLMAAPVFLVGGLYWLYRSLTRLAQGQGLHEWDVIIHEMVIYIIVPLHFACAAACIFSPQLSKLYKYLNR